MPVETETHSPKTISEIAKRVISNRPTIFPAARDKPRADGWLKTRKAVDRAAKSLENTDSILSTDYATAAVIIVDSLRTSGRSVVVTVAELIDADHSIISGWKDRYKACLLDTALAREISHTKEKLEDMRRRSLYTGLESVNKEAWDLQAERFYMVLQSQVYYQDLVRNTLSGTAN